jgi:hypothetical protein
MFRRVRTAAAVLSGNLRKIPVQDLPSLAIRSACSWNGPARPCKNLYHLNHNSKPLIELSLLQGCDIMPEDIISNAVENSRNLTLGFSCLRQIKPLQAPSVFELDGNGMESYTSNSASAYAAQNRARARCLDNSGWWRSQADYRLSSQLSIRPNSHPRNVVTTGLGFCASRAVASGRAAKSTRSRRAGRTGATTC